VGSTKRQEPLIDIKLLKKGAPVSATLDMGDMTQARKFEFDVESLNARGFLRFQKSYDPPENVAAKVIQLCKTCLNYEGSGNSDLLSIKLTDSRVKYDLLSKAHETFNHSVPNSMLHMMETVEDVVKFYCTRINTLTPYEELSRNDNLPPNLHVQKDPIRFGPGATDMFGGQTAFVKRCTIVTGLRSKKKYPGYETKMTWP